jgi:hypothetical protein
MQHDKSILGMSDKLMSAEWAELCVEADTWIAEHFDLADLTRLARAQVRYTACCLIAERERAHETLEVAADRPAEGSAEMSAEIVYGLRGEAGTYCELSVVPCADMYPDRFDWCRQCRAADIIQRLDLVGVAVK